MENNKYMDVKTTSQYIHISKSLLYQMVSKDQIPFIKIGARTIFDRTQIDQWISNGCRKVEDIPTISKN